MQNYEPDQKRDYYVLEYIPGEGSSESCSQSRLQDGIIYLGCEGKKHVWFVGTSDGEPLRDDLCSCGRFTGGDWRRAKRVREENDTLKARNSELLEALETVLKEYAEWTIDGPVVTAKTMLRVRDVIAKAKGE